MQYVNMAGPCSSFYGGSRGDLKLFSVFLWTLSAGRLTPIVAINSCFRVPSKSVSSRLQLESKTFRSLVYCTATYRQIPRKFNQFRPIPGKLGQCHANSAKSGNFQHTFILMTDVRSYQLRMSQTTKSGLNPETPLGVDRVALTTDMITFLNNAYNSVIAIMQYR